MLAADAPHVANFLGKKITPALAQKLGSRLSTRIEGRCIKHYLGAAGVKVYDKFSRVLRVETTVNDVSFFKHYRKVEHKQGEASRELAPLKKSIYSLIDLREILLGCNQRYLAFLSSLDDPSAGECDLLRLSQPRVGANPTVKGLNFSSTPPTTPCYKSCSAVNSISTAGDAPTCSNTCPSRPRPCRANSSGFACSV